MDASRLFLRILRISASICVSVSEEVVHGIPTDERIILQEGDNDLDAGIYKGYHSDAARTVGVGKISRGSKTSYRKEHVSVFLQE